MSDEETRALIAEARDRADHMTLLAKVTGSGPGSVVAREEADRMTRFADALEAERANMQALAKWVKVPEDTPSLEIACEVSSALEATLTETEWEYGVDTDRTWEGHPVMGVGQSLDEAKANVLKYAPRGTRFTNPRRRRKGREAGEWEVVPDDAEV